MRDAGDPRYRPDVDGLRAVAVLSVMLFHAFPGVLPGGFAGVGIFFVISGFLITGIILGQLERGGFTVAKFYERRIRRLFPALALVLAVCLMLGWKILLPDEFEQLGRHIGRVSDEATCSRSSARCSSQQGSCLSTVRATFRAGGRCCQLWAHY